MQRWRELHLGSVSLAGLGFRRAYLNRPKMSRINGLVGYIRVLRPITLPTFGVQVGFTRRFQDLGPGDWGFRYQFGGLCSQGLRLRLSDWGWDLEFQGVGFGVQVLGSKV